MSHNMPKFIDTKTIIVNLLKEDQKEYLSFDRLQELLNFIYKELLNRKILDDYHILFDINFDSIERTVLYNNNIFILDLDDEAIYLRQPNLISDLAKRYQVDDTIYNIIREFAA